MNLYRRLIYPALALFDAEGVHERTLSLLAAAQRIPPGPLCLSLIAGHVPSHPVHVFGLTFPNPLGIAAGFDKDARVATGLARLGFGHIEVGTVTPRAQPGNPRPRVFRLREDDALINRMGFPNSGIDGVRPRLERLAERKSDFVLGVSLGKQKETPLEDAHRDYVAVMKGVYRFADYLAVNVSSPNTPGLRELQGGEYLDVLFETLTSTNGELAKRHDIAPRPLLVKIAPDLEPGELERILGAAITHRLDGIVVANTTISRESLSSSHRDEQGGLSGKPLRMRSNELIHSVHAHCGDKLPIIGVGGVSTADDVRAKLDAGATLVQLYTGLVYEGPRIAGRIMRALASS